MVFVPDDELLDVCMVIATDLDAAQEAFKIWSWIADNAHAINSAKAGEALGTFQRMAMNETVLAIFRMYDTRNDVASVKRATNVLAGLAVRDRGAFEAYIKGLGIASENLAVLTDADLTAFGCDAIHKCRRTTIGKQLDRIQTRRHEYIAHQAMSKSGTDLFEADVVACVEWAKNFIHMTHRSFGTHSEVARVTSPKQSLINVCRKAGILSEDVAI